MQAFDQKAELSARGLVAGYVPDINILNGMSVDAHAGEIRCIIGPNGTGKSTLLKALFGFLEISAGEIHRNGQSIEKVPSHKKGAIGLTYLPQRPSVFPYLSVDANLRLGTWTFKRDKARVATKIEEAYERFPILKERRKQAAGTMSGGQQRQLEIARALMLDPSVFLIDEPTASVEPRITAQIYQLIKDLAKDGKAILLVDQNIRGALDISDYVYVMRTGALLESGPRGDFTDELEGLIARWLYTRH